MLGVGSGGPLDRGEGPCPGASRPEAARGSSCAAAGEPALPAAAPARPGPARLTEREAWAVLASVDGLGPVTFGVILRACGSARRALEAAARPGGRRRLTGSAAEHGLQLAPEVAAAIGTARDAARSLLDGLARLGVDVITAEDAAYPARLRRIELPPPVLFISGDPGALVRPRAVAVVGTRRPTSDGRRVATRLAETLADVGATVVSGLAVGIDGAAHAGALAAGGCTVAVLGSGHGRLYPAVHADLAGEIVRSGGAVVAELPPEAEPRPAGFPRRNRLIAGLADATIVVEAGERSGALITTSWALEQGRQVFAVPGPLDRAQSVGCNRLLRAHPGEVRIVAGADELIEDLGYGAALPFRRRRPDRSESPRADPGATVARLGAAEGAVARRLLAGPATADGLAAAEDLAPATVLAVLTRLEEAGLVAGVFGRYHAIGPLADVTPRHARAAGGGGHP